MCSIPSKSARALGALIFRLDGKFLFAANGPSDDVSVVDLGAEKEVARSQISRQSMGRCRGADTG